MIMNPWRQSMMPETWSTIGSTLLTFILFADMFRRYCPSQLQRYFDKLTLKITEFFDPYVQITVHEYIGAYRSTHEAYAIIESYLSVNSSKEAKRLKAEMPTDSDNNKLVLSMDENEKIMDEFNGVKLWWISGKTPPPQNQSSLSYFPDPEKGYYKLKFHKQYKKIVIESYLDRVITTGKEVQARNRQRKLYTNGNGRSYWTHIVFEHPATFETIAMRSEKKEEIIEDLLTFSRSKDFYARIGKAWKRGYLLFGPPGTGKSTMIAAMANLLDYDVYDLELTSVKDNTELRRLLTETTGKSIIVIEDIDCSLNLTGQREVENEKTVVEEGSDKSKKAKGKGKDESATGSKITLSGLLNFIDGLWSASAGERLIVFTTNHVDKLDPALTRRGRMDKHIELSYCEYEGFKVLAKNYLGLEGHPLFGTVEELIEKVKITPADVAENLMPKSAKEGPKECLLSLIHALEKAKGNQIVESGEELEGKEIENGAVPEEQVITK